MMPTIGDTGLSPARTLAADADKFVKLFRDFNPETGFEPTGTEEEANSRFYDCYTEMFETVANRYIGHALSEDDSKTFDKMLRTRPALVELMRKAFNYDEGILVMLNRYGF